jgi:hypothetical protein
VSTNLTDLPDTIVSGSTIQWSHTNADYAPDDGWTIKYGFSDGTTQKQVVGTDNGLGGFDLVLNAPGGGAPENDFAKGTWRWQAWATHTDGTRCAIQSGQVEVLPDLLNAPGDARSPAEIILDKIGAMLSGSMDKNVLNFTIADRSLSRYSHVELIDLQKHYMGIVAREKGTVTARVVF